MCFLVCAGAILQCSFGMAPSNLMVLPENKTATTVPMATIMDNKPMINIRPFGMCRCLENPMVAAATAAALGVLTPQPCIPAITAPWAPGVKAMLIDNKPALNQNSKLVCSYGGTIQINDPGQNTIQCP